MLLTEQTARLQGGDWAPFFAAECAKPYFAALDAFVTEAAAHTTVYPAAENIFAAFAACPAAGIRAVILGQDPYHEPGQAMGLSFSVPDACKAPPSLRNIFKELESETGTQRAHNDLTPWAQQGVLLLNTSLSVAAGQAGSHADWGWQLFTDAAISQLAAQRSGLVFMLWGAYAQKKQGLITPFAASQNHLLLQAPHPSPLSAHRGFLTCGHFRLANAHLQAQGQATVDWQV